MRTFIYIFLGMSLVLLISCNKESENSSDEFATNMKIDIPIVTESESNTKSEMNSIELEYSFSGSGTYQLTNLPGKKNPASVVKNIRPQNGSLLSFPVKNDVTDFSLLTMEVSYLAAPNDNFNKLESIDLLSYEYHLTNGEFKFNLDEVIEPLMNKFEDFGSNSIKVKITGKSNYSINGTAELNIPVFVETSILTPRFELF